MKDTTHTPAFAQYFTYCSMKTIHTSYIPSQPTHIVSPITDSINLELMLETLEAGDIIIMVAFDDASRK